MLILGLALSLSLICGGPALAQVQVPSLAVETQVQKGRVMVDEAAVYEFPDFDSEILGSLKKGTTWIISKRVFGAFYQVRLPKNRIGYVTDADVRSLTDLKRLQNKKTPDTPTRNELTAEANPEKRKRPSRFEDQNFQGLSFLGLRYREETMGLRPTDMMSLLGFKFTGSDVVIEGLATEFNVQFSLAPPKYYEAATGRSSDGFLFLLDSLLLNTTPHGPNTLTFWGFGPMFRFSKFSVTLPVNGRDEFYSLEDMAIGAKFNLGLAQRFDRLAVRVDLQYYWEKLHYYGLSVSGLYHF